MKNKIKMSYENGEIVIEGNRDGLRHLSEICQRLSNLSDAEANTPVNHYHISEDMNNAEQGSLPAVIIYNNEL
jgi:hypothetical protein